MPPSPSETKNGTKYYYSRILLSSSSYEAGNWLIRTEVYIKKELLLLDAKILRCPALTLKSN